MKGVKCKSHLIKLASGIFAFGVTLLLGLFINSESVNAAPLQTQIFNEFITDSNYQNQRIDGLGFGRQYRRSLTGIYWYEFVTPQMTPQGNFATIHFETNLVFETTSRENANFVNTVLNGADNLTPAVTNVWSGSTPVAIESQTTTYAVTQWQQTISGTTYYENTLTIYGDIVLSNVPSNSATYYFHVASSRGTSYTFLSLYTADVAMYFEQNPASIIYTSNVNDALLQTQIAQNEVVIQNQETTNNYLYEQQQQDQQDRDNLNNAENDTSSSSNSSQSSAQSTGTTLLKAFQDFVGALTSAQASNCVIDMDMGNLDLGNVDLCQLSLPTPLQAMASIMLIFFCVPLSIATASKLISLFRSFQG